MATEAFFDVRFQGPVKILRKMPEFIESIELEMPFQFDSYGFGGTDSLKGLKDNQIATLNGTCGEVYTYCDAEDVKVQFRKLCKAQPEFAQLEVYLSVDVTRFGLEHREFGRVWPDEDWNEFAGSYNIPYQVSGMVDIHGKEYQVNVDKIVGFPSDFEIVREDMDMGLTVSGGRVLLQLSPDEEWHCLSTEISEEDVENQGSIEEYFDSLWDFWLFGDGDCPWYELCPSDILLKILCAALPDRTLSVRECESVPHFLDTDGNEYFFGKMVSFDCEFSWEEDSNVHLTANEWKKLVFSVQDGAIYAEQVTELTVQGSAFVLSGTFVHYNDDRDKIKALIVAKGGRCTASVSGKTNYLVLGSQGSFGEKKVEQAQALQENGKDIKIITEETLFKFLK